MTNHALTSEAIERAVQWASANQAYAVAATVLAMAAERTALREEAARLRAAYGALGAAYEKRAVRMARLDEIARYVDALVVFKSDELEAMLRGVK